MNTPIPFQQYNDRLIGLLPDGRVEFLDMAVLPLIKKWNNNLSLTEDIEFDPYIKEDALLDLENFHTSGPIIAFIEVTNLCNLRCKHCYAYSGIKREFEVSTDKIFQLLDTFDEMGVFQVFLTGGEIFAHKDAVKIINYARTKKFTTQIFTNGLLITEEILSSLTPGVSFFISFDTAEPDRTIRGDMDYPLLKQCFEWMKKHNHFFRTAVSVHSSNIDDVEKIFAWCVENGYPRPQWLETHPVGRALLHPNILIQENEVNRIFEIYKRCMEKFSIDSDGNRMGDDANAETKSKKSYTIDTVKFCQRLESATQREKCARTVVYVNSSGNVYPCSNCMSGSLYCGGNINYQEFSSIWQNGFSEFRKITFDDYYKTCASCEVFKEDVWCQFRCPPLSKNISGNVIGCGATAYVKKFMLKVHHYWQERKSKNIKLVLV